MSETVHTGSLQIDLNIHESEQMDTRQNGALHSGPSTLAVTIDACAHFPEQITSQEDAKAYLEGTLAPLVALGWQFNIAIGLDVDHEPD